MGMSTHIVGVRNLDGQFQKMLAVKLACESAAVAYPPEVVGYFQYPQESEKNLRESMEEIDIKVAIEKRSEDSRSIWEVDLAKLSPEVKSIRFSNDY